MSGGEELTCVTYCEPDISEASKRGVIRPARPKVLGAKSENNLSLAFRYRDRKTAAAKDEAA